MAEAEVVAFVYFTRPQPFFQDLLGELPWRHERQIAGEGKQKNGVQPGAFEKAQFFWGRREQLQSGVWPQDAHRMRLERHRYCFASLFARPPHNVFQHGTVGTMHTVKVPHGDYRRAEAGRHIVEFMKDLHTICYVAAGDSPAWLAPRPCVRPGRRSRLPLRDLNLELQFHPVVRQLHILRQRRISGCMR